MTMEIAGNATMFTAMDRPVARRRFTRSRLGAAGGRWPAWWRGSRG